MKIRLTVVLLAAVVFSASVRAQGIDVYEKVAGLRKMLQVDQAALRNYEWIETTIVAVKGEEKSREQKRCYYGDDGVLQKVPIATDQDEDKKRGIRGKIAENKKEKMTEYIDQAIALVRGYVPLDPARIQASSDAGKVSVSTAVEKKPIIVGFRDYQVPGDSLAFLVDFSKNYVLNVVVQSLLGDDKDAVTLDVIYDKLDNGVAYPKEAVLNAPAKEIKVTLQNTGYRRTDK